MTTLEEVVNELDSLTPENLDELAHFINYLKWKQGATEAENIGQPWTFDFVQHRSLPSSASTG